MVKNLNSRRSLKRMLEKTKNKKNTARHKISPSSSSVRLILSTRCGPEAFSKFNKIKDGKLFITEDSDGNLIYRLTERKPMVSENEIETYNENLCIETLLWCFNQGMENNPENKIMLIKELKENYKYMMSIIKKKAKKRAKKM